MRPSERWYAVGGEADIPARGARVVEAEGGRVAIFRTSDGALRAIDDRCPHRGGPLSEGLVSGDTVSCPLHGICFSLESGHAIEPDTGRVTVFPLRVVDGRVEIALGHASARAC